MRQTTVVTDEEQTQRVPRIVAEPGYRCHTCGTVVDWHERYGHFAAKHALNVNFEWVSGEVK